jgi:hypothetical protein
MGIKDSSKTRVVPVFDTLYARDRTGLSWLPRLVSLPVGGSPIDLTSCHDYTIQQAGWGENEKKLSPPVALLSWLIRHPRKPTSGVLSSDPAKAQIRTEWIEGSEARILEGLALLRHNPNGKNWHIFEGKTQPDVYIQTRDLVVVIEGKRTEAEPTASTKWMEGRHQMLRHIDCAWESAVKRKIIGFLIVEGNRVDGEVSSKWMNYAQALISAEAIQASLPHRGPEEQRGIASCFAGVTTWQRVCAEFGLDYESSPRADSWGSEYHAG